MRIQAKHLKNLDHVLFLPHYTELHYERFDYEAKQHIKWVKVLPVSYVRTDAIVCFHDYDAGLKKRLPKLEYIRVKDSKGSQNMETLGLSYRHVELQFTDLRTCHTELLRNGSVIATDSIYAMLGSSRTTETFEQFKAKVQGIYEYRSYSFIDPDPTDEKAAA